MKPRGGNAKCRSTIIFDNDIEWQIYKGFTADQAEIEREPPSAVVIGLVLRSLATTDRGRWYARLMYSAESPSCMQVYRSFFEELSATGEEGGDAYPIVDHLYQYCLDLSPRMDLRDELTVHLSDQWFSVTKIMEDIDDPDDARLHKAQGYARDLSSVLDKATYANQSILPYVAFLRKEWPRLHQHSCTYRALSDLAALGQPTSKGTPETPGMRQDLIHRIDDFYEGREEAGKT